MTKGSGQTLLKTVILFDSRQETAGITARTQRAVRCPECRRRSVELPSGMAGCPDLSDSERCIALGADSTAHTGAVEPPVLINF